MSEYVFKLPDLGEGTVEAEIVEWHVAPGDTVKEDDVIVDVMTDKANVEVPAPVSGTVVRIKGEPGEQVAVGSELIVIATEGQAEPQAADAAPQTATVREKPAVVPAADTESPAAVPPAANSPPQVTTGPTAQETTGTQPSASQPVITSPAIRRQAKEAGIDLTTVPGSGPRGRILRRDLEAAIRGESRTAVSVTADAGSPRGTGPVEEIKVIGVRRVIAQRLSASKRSIPHFSYVEEVDVTALEALRKSLAERYPQQSLTYLPLIATALIRALPQQPLCNAHFDSEAGVIRRFERVHLGIAAQTPDGLKVPVIPNADTLSLWQLSQQIQSVAQGAREGTLSPKALSGSSITLTSLGKLGGIASTPVINAPEVAIIGVNKAVQRPMVIDGAVAIRTMMNLSASFDHRIVDGYDAANLIQQVRRLLEEPALLFLTPPEVH